jgi:hypothetical protein
MELHFVNNIDSWEVELNEKNTRKIEARYK